MSSPPNPTLLDFLEDIYPYGSKLKSIQHLFEPYRVRIEDSIERSYDEEVSWRDFKLNGFDFIPDEIWDAADKIIRESK